MERRAHPYEQIAAELADTPFCAIAYVEETVSTNADAAALLGADRDAGLSIVAEHQTRGAGRKGRSWVSKPGASLLCTTILPRAIDAHALWAVPFWAALAVHAALRNCGIPTTLDWPNDLLLGNGKLAGILCVSRVSGDTAWAACGVGINVHRYAGADNGGIEPPPAFCDDVTPVDRRLLLLAVLREYDASLDLLSAPKRVAALWESAAGLPGAPYRIVKDGETQAFEATALRLAAGGGLVVERDTGRLETISLADARVLRDET